jgi:hypothetical protein
VRVEFISVERDEVEFEPMSPSSIDILFRIQYSSFESEVIHRQVNSLRKPPAWTRISS